MSGWIFIVGVAFLLIAVNMRFQRREARNSELAKLRHAKRVAYFWGYGPQATEAAEKAFKDKVVEHDSWRNNIGFELRNWATFIVGVVMLLTAGLFWLGEPSHTWSQLWGFIKDAAWWLFIGGYGLYLLYEQLKRLDKADNEIRWHDQVLEQLKHHTDRLSDRLEVLEGR